MTRTSRLSWLVIALAVLVVPPALADEYIVFGESGIPAKTDIWTWCYETGSPLFLPTCLFSGRNTCATPEGSTYLNVPSNEWAGFGVFYLDPITGQNTLTEDLSAYQNGEVRFWVKSPHEIKVEFKCQGAGKAIDPALAAYGWDGNATWQEIAIPVVDFFGGSPVDLACLQNIQSAFMATAANVPTNFQIDHVRWYTAPPALPGASSVTVDHVNRQLLVDGKPFVVNGMSYSPHLLGEDWHGNFVNRPALYAADFPAIAATGANAIRLYSAYLTTALLDEAWANGLYVIPTFGIDRRQLECDAGRSYMQDRLEDLLLEWKDHPAILYWLLGNEVDVGLTTTELCDTGSCSVTTTSSCAADADCTGGWCSFTTTTPCTLNTDCPQVPVAETCIPETCVTGWYPSLDELALTAHQAEGASFHPVSTSTGDVGSIGLAACSTDSDLQNLDLWSTNLYKGCTFGTALTSYQTKSGKALVISEFGVDAWNASAAGGPMEDQAMQSDCFETLLDEAGAELTVHNPTGATTGQIIFSWADEWWKSYNGGGTGGLCDETSFSKHDTCEDWVNTLYTVDSSMNEEWWGITTREMWCQDNNTVSCKTDDDCGLGSCAITTTATCSVVTDCPLYNHDFNPGTPDVHENCLRCSVVLDPAARVPRASHAPVGDAWMGPVCDMMVDDHAPASGDIDISFPAAKGNPADYNLYYGPLGAVSTYGYTGSVKGLGTLGSSTIAGLPDNSFFLVVAETAGLEEGCYGLDSGGSERPCFPDPGNPLVCDTDPTPGWNCR